MIVMKFGGTSVQDPEALGRLARLVARERARPPLVVVSAMGKTTNRLLGAAEAAVAGRPAEARAALRALREEHGAAALTLEPAAERSGLLGRLALLFDEAEGSLDAIAAAGRLEQAASDALLATGELASSLITAAALAAAGLPAFWVDVRPLVLTGEEFTRAAVRMEETATRLRGALARKIADGRLAVTQGFLGATADGRTTTLGRGGSDYSAALIGAALGATEIQIWTDVDGVMTTDPRVLPAAVCLPTISFAEAAELAYFGAKVLHPATIRPAMARDIPVRVLNSWRPEGAGTTIVRQAPPPAGGVRAIAMKRDITVVNVTSDRMLMAHGFLARLFDVFSRHDTAVDMVTTSEVSVSMTLDDTRHLEAIREELEGLGEVVVESDQAIVCLVGDGLKEGAGLVARVFRAVDGIPVSLISHGASAINISFVVPGARLDGAVRALHAEFFAPA